mmetsp:Transcript_16791/g.23359  ORF Transcript_16791/g.23359 Transcript_16791/m.23359 type:complete len:329 (-) Transcript_16791:43-1029(-)
MAHNPNKDIEVPSPPNDSISSLAFSPKGNFLVAGSWDNQVRCWEVQGPNAIIPKASYNHEAPVLCATWSSDGTKVFSGSCDGKGKMWTAGNPQPVQIAQHSAGIKSCFWVDDVQCLVTGSWDKTLKYWDARSPNPVHSQNLPERVYSMDVKSPLCVVATADRQIVIFDMRKPNVEFKRIQSPLKFQSRTISCFMDKTGFALGSIEGRVAIHHVEDKDAGKNFAFKCHRENNEIYAVNAISFHPQWGTFSTAGSDGTFNFWDKDSKQRLKPFSKCPAPISATCWNMDGSIFAYAVSYDWFRGIEGYNANNKNFIFLHSTPEMEIKNRKK